VDALTIGPGRAVEVLHDRGPATPVDVDRWTGASGYLIGGRLVLTAAHTVDYRRVFSDDEQLLVRTIEGSEFAARVVLVCDELSQVDLALLEISDPQFSQTLPAVAFARVDRHSPAPVPGCWAVGFPRFGEAGPVLPGGSRKETWQVRGDILPGGKLRAGLLSLQVTTTPQTSVALAGSSWAGMSGAVAFATDPYDGQQAIGVVTTHHRAEGESALTVVPITAVAGLPTRTQWCHLLGVPDPDALPLLPRQQRPEAEPVRLAPRPVFLVGREELLTELDAALLAGDRPWPRTVVLYGLGGAGKTSVALAYAHRHLAEAGLAWQFAAEDPAVLSAGFGELAAQLGVRDSADMRDPVASVHAVLAKYPAGWLLVFDNVPDRASVEAFLPPAGRGRVLITSQSSLWPPGQALEVPALGTQVAADFLVSRTGDLDHQAAADLARELGGLALALEQAAAYMQATGDSLADYLASFRRGRLDMLDRGEPIGYGKTVATTWALAFTRLEQSAPGAAGLLRLLAFCAPEAIPWRLLLQSRPGLTGRLRRDVAVVLTPLLTGELAAKDAIAALRRYSLISPAAGRTVSVHRLVQAVTADQMPAKLAEAWRHTTAAVIEAAIPDDPKQPDSWADFAALLPHAQAALPAASDGMERISSYLGHSIRHVAARDLYLRVVEARDRVLGPEHPGTLAARASLARWTGEAGDARAARDLYAALLPVYERVLGMDHPEVLEVRRHFAFWAGEAGDKALARDQSAQLVAAHERVLGPEHPDTLAARAGHADLTGLTGDAGAARALYAELLPICKRVLGPEHKDTPWNRLAYWTGKAGDAAGARALYTELLPIRERVLGPEHPDVLDDRARLADWTGKAGDAAGARALYTELLPIRERVLGPEHPRTQAARADLAYWTRQADGGAEPDAT